jgi:hypothetical protein
VQNVDINIGFWENANFSPKIVKIAENCQKSPKIVIIISTPDPDFQKRFFRRALFEVIHAVKKLSIGLVNFASFAMLGKVSSDYFRSG